MIAQIFAVVIFITMFVFIVTEIVERHIVSLISALLTMIFVFGIGMQSMEAIWETLNISSIFSPVLLCNNIKKYQCNPKFTFRNAGLVVCFR